MNQDRFAVEHRPEESRYVLLDRTAEPATQEIGEESYVDVEATSGTQRVLFHTGVSDEYGGQGLASRLVQEVVDDVVAGGRSIVPVCPYVVKWLEQHSDYAEHVVKPRPEHLRAVDDR